MPVTTARTLLRGAWAGWERDWGSLCLPDAGLHVRLKSAGLGVLYLRELTLLPLEESLLLLTGTRKA